MPHFSYSTFPSVAQFQKDSNVTMANRKDDVILSHLDWLIERYQEVTMENDWSKRRVLLADVFLTCNYWIKLYHEKHPKMLKERYPAVLALFEAAVIQLQVLLGCTKGQVAETIDEMYGRGMHDHGYQVDYKEKRVMYLSKAQASVYRIRFKGGLAYQYDWWEKSGGTKLVLAESERAYVEISRRGENGQGRAEALKNFGGFAMNIERELFMAKHDIGNRNGNDGIFHSSYNNGSQVIMAGTMHIEKGKILAIRGDSGHYKPTEQNMAMLLQSLAMFNVDLDAIRLINWKGDYMGRGLEFLRSHMSWEQFCDQQKNEKDHRAKGAESFKQYGPKHPVVDNEPINYNMTT